MRPAAPYRWLCAILVASFLLRVDLILAGGQFYWQDENRYAESQRILESIARGDLAGALVWLDRADHWLFKIIGVVPAAIESITVRTAKTPAFFFGMFSLLNLWLIWTISRRIGSSEYESLFAVFLVALSSTFLYYSRHVLPYDLALTFGLCAVMVGLKDTPRRSQSLLCGVLAACAFLTYAGYWTLAALALLIHIGEARPFRRLGVRRAVFSSIGLVLPIVVILALSVIRRGTLLQSFIRFARTVDQGSYAEGWRLPLAYFWHAEHLLLVLWGVGLAWSLRRLRDGRRTPPIRIGLLGLGFIYGALVLTSVGLHAFVVYGRLARQLVPFFCILTAHAMEHVRTSTGKTGRGLLVASIAALIIQAGWNFNQPLRQLFPEEFRQQARAFTEDLDPSHYTFVNAERIYPEPTVPRLPRHRIVMHAAHPLEFLPYQYEGYDPSQRHKLRAADLTMRLVVFLSESD